MTAGPDGSRGVTVVIPTIGRSSLWAAVESAHSCATPSIKVEVLVCADMAEGSLEEEWRKRRDRFPANTRLLYSGGNRGACAARNIGLDASSMSMVAFLDDDDRFLPSKLALQVPLLEDSQSPERIVAGRARYLLLNGRASDVPRQVYRDGPLGDYLFVRRRLSPDRNLIPTPTWLMYTEFARAVRWSDGLARHQDWDFLLRAQGSSGAVLVQIDDLVAEVQTESVESVTSSAGLGTSFAWAQSVCGTLTNQAFVDFVVGQPVRHAFQSRHFRLGLSFLRQALAVGRPSFRACWLALSGLLPRPALARLMALRAGGSRLKRGEE